MQMRKYECKAQFSKEKCILHFKVDIFPLNCIYEYINEVEKETTKTKKGIFSIIVLQKKTEK